jgi:hypothetical protein
VFSLATGKPVWRTSGRTTPGETRINGWVQGTLAPGGYVAMLSVFDRATGRVVTDKILLMVNE